MTARLRKPPLKASSIFSSQRQHPLHCCRRCREALLPQWVACGRSRSGKRPFELLLGLDQLEPAAARPPARRSARPCPNAAPGGTRWAAKGGGDPGPAIAPQRPHAAPSRDRLAPGPGGHPPPSTTRPRHPAGSSPKPYSRHPATIWTRDARTAASPSHRCGRGYSAPRTASCRY